MEKIELENGIQLKITLKEIYEVYLQSEEMHICFALMDECESELTELLIPVDALECESFSSEFCSQWMSKILGMRDEDISSLKHKGLMYFEDWNDETEYSYKSFFSDDAVPYNDLNDVEYRRWVLKKAMDKFADVEFNLPMVRMEDVHDE